MINSIKYPRGSEWRKWDLHFHTPSSYDCKTETTTDQQIIDKLKEENIALVAITDHHKIDVQRIKHLQELAGDDITILPGIELRSELGGHDSVHFCAIFPENSNINTIWTKLQGKLNITEDDVDKIGNDKIFCDLKDSCEYIHNELKGIVTIHAGSKTSSVEGISNALPYKLAQKTKIVEAIDIYEIGKKEDIIDYETIVFPSIKKIFPLIICSDCHKINSYSLKENCWVKANPTFEGLKQIIYEPQERVKIQEIKPDEKLSYQIIDNVTYKNKEFIDSKIELNQNLTSIIGDKSTGKSILLRSIARSIDLAQVEEKYDNIKEPLLEDPVMEICWKDGEIDKESIKTGRKIIYIPQTFLNEKIDKNEPNSFINTILHDVLVQKNEFRQVIEKIVYVEKDINNSINDKINSIFLIQDKISEATKRVNELGNKEYIEKEIARLDEECKMLHKQGGATPEDIGLYNLTNKEFSDKIRLHSIKLENLKNLGLILNTADTIKSSELITFQIPHFKSLEYDLQEEMDKKFAELKDSTKIAISCIFKLKFNEIYFEIDILKNRLEELNESLNPLKNKLAFSDTIKKKADLLKNEEQKLIILNKEIKLLTRLKSEFDQTIDEVIKFNADYENKLNVLKKQLPSNIFIDVNFTIDILFNESKFNDTMKDLLNSKKFSAFKEKTDIDLSNFKFVNSSDFNLSLKKIIIGILEKDLPTKSKYTPKDAILYLLQNWFFFKYNVEEEGDKLENMSPGKRSFILLKILIDLDNSKWPILIDQPEDDLDAKSVSKQLIKYLKEKKKDRQIIIVSHNPNLVVGADSEQIIVANQHGSNLKNISKQFEYVMGSIEDTFTNQEEECILYSKGIKEHICDILEGGEEAFKMRQSKYNIK